MLFSLLLLSFANADQEEARVGKIYGLDNMGAALDEALDRNNLAGIPKATPNSVFVGENRNWFDTWGWCVKEDSRRNLPNQISRAACLVACDKETWNGEYGTGCEWSESRKSCAVFFGKMVEGTKRGSNYRCNKGKPKWRNFRDDMDGRVGVYRNSCAFQDTARGCVARTHHSGPDTYTTCTCSAITEFFECNVGYIANGVGSVTRGTYADCVDRFKNTGKKFVYYADSEHCQETEMNGIRASSGWMVCTPTRPYDSFDSVNPYKKDAEEAQVGQYWDDYQEPTRDCNSFDSASCNGCRGYLDSCCVDSDCSGNRYCKRGIWSYSCDNRGSVEAEEKAVADPLWANSGSPTKDCSSFDTQACKGCKGYLDSCCEDSNCGTRRDGKAMYCKPGIWSYSCDIRSSEEEAEETFAVTQEMTIEDYGVWGFAAVGLGAIVYAAKAALFPTKNAEFQELV